MGTQRNRMLSLFGSIIICMFIVGASTGCGGNSEKRIAFSPADLEGKWQMIHVGRALYGPFSGSGTITLNASGEVTGGKVSNYGVDQHKVTGGTILITPEGMITGEIDVFLPDSSTEEKKSLYSGRMSENRNIIIYAASLTLGRKGMGILVKAEGGHALADLNGAWIFPLDGFFTASMNDSGVITDCRYQPVEGDPKVCQGALSAVQEGNLSGRITFADGRPFTTNFLGFIDAENSSMLLWGSISSRFEGMSTFALKQRVDLSADDVHGRWHIFMPLLNDVLYGTVDINDSGTVVGGVWKNSQKQTGSFTGGTVIVTGEEKAMLGSFSTSAGHTYKIIGGSMGSSGDILLLSAKDEAGLEGMLILLKDTAK